jgi:hypothetical protein
MFYIDFGDFQNNPISLSFNSIWQKTPSISIFDFLGAMRLQTGQGQRTWFGNIEMNKMS